MPTQEERLGIVEYGLKQYKTETIKAYGEMAMELIMIKGLTEDSVRRLMTMERDMSQLKTTLGEHSAHLNRLETTLGEHTTHLNRLETTLGEHSAHLDRLETTLGEHTTLLTQILARLPEKP